MKLTNVFTGQITWNIGKVELPEQYVAVTNVERFMYREVPNPSLVPITVMNTMAPIGFRQLHKWYEGEIHVKSEAYAAVHNNSGSNYLPSGSAGTVIPFFEVDFNSDTSGTWTVHFSGSVLSGEELSHGHDDLGITIYRFVARQSWFVTGS